jgi:hypothetical protein
LLNSGHNDARSVATGLIRQLLLVNKIFLINLLYEY